MLFEPFLEALAFALILEALWGDPRSRWHPVAAFGQWSSWLEKQLWHNSKAFGCLAWHLSIVPVFSLLFALNAFSESLSSVTFTLFNGALLWVSIGWKSLIAHVKDVANSDSLKTSRIKVGYIVGRETGAMNQQDIHRATVETLAENTSDSIIAPLFWFFLFGGLGAWTYRMINTLDAMWGYKHNHYLKFGWWAAKTDDFANYIPARLTATLMLLQKPVRISKKIYNQACQHNSPNAGFPETAMAFLLNIQLGGDVQRKDHIEHRPLMGTRNQPIEQQHILQSIRISNYATLMFIIFLTLLSFSL